MFLPHIPSTTLMVDIHDYRIAGNIGGELNLADWRFWKQAAKLKSANIYIVTCAKTDRRFTMLRYFKRSRSSVCPSRSHFLQMKNSVVRAKCRKFTERKGLEFERASWKVQYERRGKYNNNNATAYAFVGFSGSLLQTNVSQWSGSRSAWRRDVLSRSYL